MSEFQVIGTLFWLLLIGSVFYFFVSRRKKKAQRKEGKKLFQVAKEGAASEAFFLLSVLFFGVTLLSFNSDFHQPLSWRTILFVTSAAGIACAYVFKAASPLAFGLISLLSWWCAQAFEWSETAEVKSSPAFTGLICIGLLFYALGRLHEGRKRFALFSSQYLVLGTVFTSLILFYFSTSSGLKMLEDISIGASFLKSWQLVLFLFIFLGFLVTALLYGYGKKRIHVIEVLVTVFVASLFLLIAFLPMQEIFVGRGYIGSALSSKGIFWAVFFNLLVFFELLGLILLGYQRQNELLVNAGAVFLFIFILIKYVDWFFKFLDKSIFFIGAGILLFGVGWLMERGRRYMLARPNRLQYQ